MRNRYSPSNISDIADKKIFFDTNILIYIFGFGTHQNWESQYANLYSELNNQDNKFVVDFIVISEFINRVIKLEYENYRTNSTAINLNYKNYRNSQDGKKH